MGRRRAVAGSLLPIVPEVFSSSTMGYPGVKGMTSAVDLAQNQFPVNICGAELTASTDGLGF